MTATATTGTAPEPVTPGEIDAVQFTQVVNWFSGRRGYDEIEVDAFLDRVADTIARQQREIQALGSRVEQTGAANCRCNHTAFQHLGSRCNGHNMSGGANGIMQRCACTGFEATS